MLTLPWATRGDVVDLMAVRDATLYESASGNLANGSGNQIFAGRTEKGFVRRALLRFDPSTGIPSGSEITGVELTLTMTRTKARSENITLHRVLMDWGEGISHAPGEEGGGTTPAPDDATWIHRFYDYGFWSTPGGDFVSTPSATLAVNKNGAYVWTSPSMITDVEAWLANPAMNFGWLLKGNENQNKTAKRFESRQSVDPSSRPRLRITFNPPTDTGACCFTNGNCQVMTEGQCQGQGGTYQGDGVPCTPQPCPQPPATGACCFADGSCDALTAEECAQRGGNYQGDHVPCSPGLCPVVLAPYVDPLPVPPVVAPAGTTPEGVKRYLMRITQFTQKLHRDLPPTIVWGFEGSYPGPTIEAARGEEIRVVWTNDLRQANGAWRTNHFLPVDLCPHGPDHAGPTPRTVIHLHGGHVPPGSDGYPEATFLPGESAEYIYPNSQPAATLWYHDHALGITRLNVYMGLAGFYLIRDDNEASLNLPSAAYEIPLVIQDRLFRGDGSLDYPATWQEHFFGDKILVNGKVWPYLEVDRGLYRLRLANGCNSRTLTLAMSSGESFQQIGTDSGFLAAPVSLETITLAPGERADTIVDFSSFPAGTEILLTNSAPAPYPNDPGVRVIPQVMKFIVGSSPGHTTPVPPVLATIPPPPVALAVEDRTFHLRKGSEPCSGNYWLINDLEWDDITEYPVMGTTEIWNFVNRSGVMHPMHMHLVLFQVLDRQPFVVSNDTVVVTGPRVPAPAWEAGWKDTVQVNPSEITRVITRFEDYTGKYAYHCHILEHEDHEMMRQFQVVPPPRFLDIEWQLTRMQLRFFPTPGRFHDVEYLESFALPVWMNLTSGIPGADEPITITDDDISAPQRIYRIQLQPSTDGGN